MLHAQIGEDEGYFAIEDVIEGIISENDSQASTCIWR